MPEPPTRLLGSFRDPAGRVCKYDGRFLREVFHTGRKSYELLLSSGLYERLVARGLLIPHVEVERASWNHPDTWRVLNPEPVPFISYSFEWCFSQLQEAALATLALQEEALQCGMTLKDASPDNIQFLNGKPVLIDTLSFEPAGPAWTAYYQFCKRFLAPLLLTVYRNAGFLRMTALESDGIPLGFASSLLPWHTWLRPSTAFHIHLHDWADRRRSGTSSRAAAKPQTRERQRALVDSLRRIVEGLTWRVPNTEWTGYEDHKPTYSATAWAAREQILQECLERVDPSVVWDLGAALGHASRLASARGALTIAFDADSSCIELMWRRAHQQNDRRLLPLVQDLLRPTPRSGWAEEELLALSDRGPADLLLVLGLLHHVTMRGGIPIDRVFEYFSKLGRAAVVEFIPPTDPIVSGWCASSGRAPVTEDAFKEAACRYYPTAARFPVADSTRIVYLLQRT